MRTALQAWASRHAAGLAMVVLVASVAAFAGFVTLAGTADSSGRLPRADLLYFACQVLPYGLIGAVLMAKRPDLPFGWLLSLAAMSLVVMLAVMAPALWRIENGHGGQLAVWGLTFGSLAFVPTALQGIVNVRFPSGRPSGRVGRLLDRALVWGISLALVGGFLGDRTVGGSYPDGVPGGATRFVDGTPIVSVANVLVVAVPAVILLGVLAGIGVVVRWVRAEGLQRKQLQWRAAGAVIALLLFPFAVSEVLPAWATSLDPLVFVVTLVIPVLRYDLWAIDSVIRRSATYGSAGSGASAVEAMMRATVEMLRLPYAAVRSGDRVLATHGEPTTAVESWPLIHSSVQVGELVAAPRHGWTALDVGDRQVLSTLADLLAGSVRAESLTADLLEARQRLVETREEERRRLRRDLHDGLGPMLTGLGLNLDAAAANLHNHPDRAEKYLDNASDASKQLMGSLRELVQGLRPPALDDLGFVGALRLHTDRIARDAGLQVRLFVPDQLILPAAVEVAAFRTVLEAVTNVVRHSQASSVNIEIVAEGNRLSVVITDDAPIAQPWPAGVGLAGMQERAQELGGTFEAGPTPHGGRVRVTYPLAGSFQ